MNEQWTNRRRWTKEDVEKLRQTLPPGAEIVDIMERYQEAGGDRRYGDVVDYIVELEEKGYGVTPLGANKVVLVNPQPRES